MASDTYKLRRAYAILGLKPGTPISQARRRYKALVKMWHPDRYATDPVGQREAENRMREINAAYRRLVETLSPNDDTSPSSRSASSARPARERLSRDEIEHLVESIGTQGPLDDVLDAIGWVGDAFYGIVFLLFVVFGFMRVALLLWTGKFGDSWVDPFLLLFVVIVASMAWFEYRERRTLKR